MDTSGIEPDTSRMLSERDKPTTPCALASLSHYLLEERRLCRTGITLPLFRLKPSSSYVCDRLHNHNNVGTH